MLLAHRVGKKTNKRKKKLDRALQVINKHKKKKKPVAFNFSAIHLVHDPQGFAEKLFKQLESSTERFEVKLMLMNLISRLVGIHQLFLFNFYPLLQRFLQPHQREVTKILVIAAQASHELVPPEMIESILMTIANNFITERNSSEVMAVGLNAVREVCSRCPLAMTEDLMRDLSDYKNGKNKSVNMAAHSLIQLFRRVNPSLLHKKDRGKPTDATSEMKPLQYGDVDAKDYLPGAEILKDTDTQAVPDKSKDDWESCSEDGLDDMDDEDGWIDIIHSSDEDQEEDEELAGMAPEDKVKKAKDITTSRILTQEEFKQIRNKQMSKELGREPKTGKKRRSNVDEMNHEGGETVSLAAIERIHKRPRHDKESRLATVMAGREGREKFGHREHRMNPNASTTNKEKRKHKSFMMLKHKVTQQRTRRSFHEKQMALKKSLLKRQKAKK